MADIDQVKRAARENIAKLPPDSDWKSLYVRAVQKHIECDAALGAELESLRAKLREAEGQIGELTAQRDALNGDVHHLGAQVEGVRAAVTPCKGEQDHFETWAIALGYDMHEHPLHYLFLNEKTNAARAAWKAALRYAESALPSTGRKPVCEICGKREGHHHKEFDGFACEECQSQWTDRENG